MLQGHRTRGRLVSVLHTLWRSFAADGMKTMGKALEGLTTAKKPLVRRLKRGRAGEGRSG